MMNQPTLSDAVHPIPDLASAKRLAQSILSKEQPNHEWIIVEHLTAQRTFGWVFFYTTKKHWETKNPRFMVPGNGPLLIEQQTGKHSFLPTMLPPKQAIDEFEAIWKRQNE